MKRKIFIYSIFPTLGLAGVLLANVASAHGFFGGFGFGNATPDQIATQQQTMFQNQAAILGLGIDDVKNAWAEGKTMKQLMDEKGITQDQVQARMKDARLAQLKSQLQTLVDKGIITQAQSDKRLAAMQNQIQNGMGRGHKGMMGFGHGFGF